MKRIDPSQIESLNKLILATDIHYYGETDNGKMHGLGKIEAPLCSVFGTFSKGELLGFGHRIEFQEIGTSITPKMAEYGYYVKGDLQGFGNVTLFDSGIKKFGEFKDGKLTGKGIKSTRTTTFTGYFKDDVQHGPSIIEKEGYYYQGNTKYGDKHGFGVEANENKSEIYRGHFYKNSRTGICSITWDSNTNYIGEIKDDKIEGFGKMTKPHEYYVGSFWSNKKNGLGYFKQGKHYNYIGEWLEDQRSGLGLEQLADEHYKGEFQSGVRHGLGIVYNLRSRLTRRVFYISGFEQSDPIDEDLIYLNNLFSKQKVKDFFEACDQKIQLFKEQLDAEECDICDQMDDLERYLDMNRSILEEELTRLKHLLMIDVNHEDFQSYPNRKTFSSASNYYSSMNNQLLNQTDLQGVDRLDLKTWDEQAFTIGETEVESNSTFTEKKRRKVYLMNPSLSAQKHSNLYQIEDEKKNPNDDKLLIYNHTLPSAAGFSTFRKIDGFYFKLFQKIIPRSLTTDNVLLFEMIDNKALLVQGESITFGSTSIIKNRRIRSASYLACKDICTCIFAEGDLLIFSPLLNKQTIKKIFINGINEREPICVFSTSEHICQVVVYEEETDDRINVFFRYVVGSKLEDELSFPSIIETCISFAQSTRDDIYILGRTIEKRGVLMYTSIISDRSKPGRTLLPQFKEDYTDMRILFIDLYSVSLLISTEREVLLFSHQNDSVVLLRTLYVSTFVIEEVYIDPLKESSFYVKELRSLELKEIKQPKFGWVIKI